MTVREGADEEEVVSLLHQHRIEKVLVVGDNFELKGMITAKDFQKAKDFPRACKDSSGALRVGAAVGTGYDSDDRVDALVEATDRVLGRAWDANQLRNRADLFSREQFRTRFGFLLDRLGFGETPQ